MSRHPRAIIADRLKAAGLPNEHFIQCREGTKVSTDHSFRSHQDVDSEYGIYATAKDGLAILDIDDYDELDDATGLNALAELPATFEQESPHGGTHRLYAVEPSSNGRLIAAVLEDEFGSKNLTPTWGEVRVAGQYVVGAGSELTACDKDWHKCREPGEGEYQIKEDRPIATIEATELVEVLRADPNYADTGRSETSQDVSPPPTDRDIDEILDYARECDDKLADLLDGRYGAAGYPDDRSKAEFVLALKLAFWLQGDKSDVEYVLDHHARTKKWDERDDESYRNSVLDAVDKQDEFYDPSESSHRPDEFEPGETDDSEVTRGENILEAETSRTSPAGRLVHKDGRYGIWKEYKDENDDTPSTRFVPEMNFTLETRSYIDTYEGELLNIRVHPAHPMEEPFDVQVHPTVFNEPTTFRDEIVRGRTLRFEPERGIREVLNDIRQTVGSQMAPKHEGTEYIGLHGDGYDEWVTPNGTLTADGWSDEPDYVYYEKGGNQDMQSSLEQHWQLSEDDGADYDEDEVREITELLGWTRRPDRGLPVIGWFYAAPLKPVIHDKEGEFNLLQVTGGTGAGKTSMLEMCYEAFGADPTPFGCDDKGFTIEKKLASSCGLPIWLDEYKPSDIQSGKLQWLHRRLREVYREKAVSKGRADLGEVTFRMRAPVVFSGEQTVQAAAVRRRTIMTNLSSEGTEGRHERAFCRLTGATYTDEDGRDRYPSGMDLKAHGLAYYQFICQLTPDDVEQTWEDAREDASDLLHDLAISGLDASEFQGVQTVVFGYRMYRAFAEHIGADVSELPDKDDLRGAVRTIAENIGPEGQRREHIDDFTELLSQAAAAGYLEPGVHHRIIDSRKWDKEVLAFHMPTAFSAVKKYVREYNLEDDYSMLGKDDYVDSYADKSQSEESYPLATNKRTRGIENGSKAVYLDPEQAEGRLGSGFNLDNFREDDETDDSEGYAGGDDDGGGSDAATISEVADGDTGVTIEGEVTDRETDTPPQIAEKAKVADVTGETTVTIWDDANKPALEEGACYRFKDVSLETYEGNLEVQVNNQSGVTKINAGVGNAPASDPGDNQQIDAAADGGGIEGLRGQIKEHLRINGPTKIPELAGAIGEDPSAVKDRLDDLRGKGEIDATDDGAIKLR